MIDKKAILLLSVSSVFLVIGTFGLSLFGARAKEYLEQLDIKQTIQALIYLSSEAIMVLIISTIFTKNLKSVKLLSLNPSPVTMSTTIGSQVAAT